jgi:hypothetical protein
MSAMSEHLGIGDRTIRRWASGSSEPPAALWQQLLATIEERQQQLAEVRDQLERHLTNIRTFTQKHE